MIALFHALTERLKALFISDVALDFEAELLARAAERQAELLRRADRYDSEGLSGIAGQLRRQAEAIDLQRPLAGILPALEHLQATPRDDAPPPRLRLVAPDVSGPATASRASPGPNTKRGGKS
jgi:hypothetical protein